MTAYDWTRFTKRIDVKASTAELYQAWTTRSGIESWFLRVSQFSKPDGTLRAPGEAFEKGDSYKWMWHGWPDEVAENGKVLQANGRDFIQFTFGGNPNSPITVSVIFRIEENVQVVELTQENIPDDEQGKLNYHFGCMEGWTFYLVNLKSILEGGIDLRNRNEKLQNIINK